MWSFEPPRCLRSPRERLDGYVILPRLIDKVRAYARGELPKEYHRNLLRPGVTLDGRFLRFTGLDADALRAAILSTTSDEEVVRWIAQQGVVHSDEEKRQWAIQVESYRPEGRVLAFLQAASPALAAKVDLSRFSLFDVIDMDEGRLAIPV